MKRTIFFIAIWIGICFPGIGQISKNVTTKQSDLNIARIGEYDKVSLDRVFYTTDVVGLPELPVDIQSFIVPIDAQMIEININRVSKQKLEGTYHIYPVQPPRPVASKDSINDFILPDPVIYHSSRPYPDKQAEIISDDIFLGYRIVTVRLYPVEYKPHDRELYVCNFDFSIDYSINLKQTGSNEFVTKTQSEYRYELNKKNVKFSVENPEAVDSYDTKVQKVIQGRTVVRDFSIASNDKKALRSQSVSVLNEPIPDYIIITNNALKSSFQTLAGWKTRKGIFTIIVTTEEINANYSGIDLQEKIRNYLLDANNRWGSGLYILLGGGIDIIPPRLIKGVDKPALSYPSDRYYSTSTSWSVHQGNVYKGNTTTSIINLLGRIPVSNAQEVSAYTNKLIAYEKANGLGDLNYLKNNLYADAYMKIDASGMLYNFFHKSIKDYRLTYVPNHINNKYICDNANCSGSLTRYGTSGSDCSNGNTNGDIELNPDNFLSCLSTGAGLGVGKFHFVYHLDHSGAQNLGTSYTDKGKVIHQSKMDELTNGSSYQILMSSSCHPADFYEYNGECVAKHYLMHPNGGGVTFIGNADVGWQPEAAGQLRDFLDAIYTTTGHPSLGRYDVASAYQKVCTGTTLERWRLHLLGDPEMQVWTDVPSEFINASVSQSGTSVTVNTGGISDCTIAVTSMDYGKSYFQVEKNVSSYTFTNVTTPYYVTITKHNYIPYTYPEDVYIQNEMITSDSYISGRNIYVGHHVTTSKPQGNVLITNNAKVIFDAAENVRFDTGFKCDLGASFEVVKR